MGDRFSSLAAAPANTRAVIVVSPNNPTGSYVSARDVEHVSALCRDRGWALIVDEVFADYPLEADAPLTDIAARSDVLAFTLGGLSKSAGLPQLKLGWIVVGGPPAARDAALAGLELIADSFLSVATPVQLAAADLLEHAASIRTQIHERVRANLAALRDGARPFAACEVLRTEGGWSAVIRVPATRSEEQLVLDLLEHEGILVHPGYFFDFPARGVCRGQPSAAARRLPRRVDASAAVREFVMARPEERGITLAPCVSRPYDATALRITPRGGVDPAVLHALVAELGRRRDRRHRGDRALARRRRPADPAAPADQRDASGRVVAVFRAQRDGDRSAVHHARSRRGLRGDRRRGGARARVARAARRRPRRAEDSVRRGQGAETRRAAAVLRAFPRHRVERRHAPRRGVPLVHRRSRRGGSTNTRCSARCTRATRSARGPTGQSRCARASPRRSMQRAPSWPTRSSSGSTCSGWRATSGARRAIARGRRRAVRRPAVHGERRQRRRLGAAGRVPDGRVGGRPARRLQRHRAGLGTAGLPVGRPCAARFRLAARPRAPQRRSVRRLPRGSPRRVLPHLLPAARRRAAAVHAAGCRKRSWRLASACWACSASRGRRSSPKISASSPNSCARR